MLCADAIRRVTLRSAQPDSPALRQSVERQLAGADFRLPGAPPAGLLLVRSLADPLPGRISASPMALRADAGWERALCGRLESLRRDAARPAGGFVDASAPAVWFEDESELTACLALSLAHGAAVTWWRAAVASFIPTVSLARLLAEQVDWLPAAFARLAGWGHAETVARNLSSADAAELIVRVSRAFGLPALLSDAARWLETDRQLGPHPLSPARSEADFPPVPGAEKFAEAFAISPGTVPASRGRPQERRFAPPWRHWWLPKTSMGLAPIKELLIGVATGIQLCRPRLMGVQFGREMQGWLDGVANAEQTESPPPVSANDDRAAVGARPKEQPVPAQPEAAFPKEISGNDQVFLRRGKTVSPPTADPSRLDADESGAPSTEPPEMRMEGMAGRSDRSDDPSGGKLAVADFREQSPSGEKTPATAASQARRGSPEMTLEIEESWSQADRRPWPEEGMDTALGGVLYLINLLEFLELPDCFEEQCRLATAVGAAATLETVARALLGGLAPELWRDPVWEVLAGLDGRAPGEPPPASGMIAGDLRLPTGWLSALGGEAPLPRPLSRPRERGEKAPSSYGDRGWGEGFSPISPASGSEAGDNSVESSRHRLFWNVSDGRLLLWSKAGFPIADLGLKPGPVERQALAAVHSCLPEGETADLRYAESPFPLNAPASLTSLGWPEPLVRWAAFVAPYLRVRLARALGHSPDANTVELSGAPSPPAPLPSTGEGRKSLSPLRREGLGRGAFLASTGASNLVSTALSPDALPWLEEELAALPGRIYQTETHVDLVMSMDSIRLPLRLAGLDRSPGWLPKLGRVVLFHFD